MHGGQVKVIDKYFSYLEPEGSGQKKIIWLWGPTGSGKSRWAREHYPNCYKKNKTKWWDGYDRHKCVLYDDFRGSDVRFSELLQILDRYEYRCEVKGGFRQLACDTIVITSIKSPRECYHKEDEDLQQLMRRITTCIYTGDVDWQDNNLLKEQTL